MFEISGFTAPINTNLDIDEITIKKSKVYPKSDSQKRVIPTYYFDIPGWIKIEQKNEVLLYIPGFNCTTEGACESLGQMMALLNPLPNLKPIVFNWPSGGLITFAKATKVAVSHETMDDLSSTFSALLRHFRKIHVLTHSMGARVINAFSRHLGSIFEPGDKRLSSVTLLNPESNMDSFIDDHFVQLRKYTDVITLYSNKSDIALYGSELILRCKQLGKHPNSLISRDGRWLDLDVIDTSELDTNVQIAKHSYFSLNRLCLDDLGEIFQHGIRASFRSKVVPIEGNVYRFLAAPSYVVTS